MAIGIAIEGKETYDRATLRHLREGCCIKYGRDGARYQFCFTLYTIYIYHCLTTVVQCSVVRFVYCILEKMTSMKLAACAFVIVCVSIRQSMAAPAPAPQEENYPPMPYEYKYDVEDQEKLLYFGANEAGDAQGKVIGGYKVLLPDGRLMNVEYTVEGDSGFVPKISFEENANPFGKGK